eukprot:TRINITY_DN29603_c0_g2_i1.p1 TRINITY_DN29603_c0_g2~~TRINITY_DN29603_c0_g2_i1.p1  ORF type:complete len:1840 (+),score=613.07 TRINITY_DN29603_c0_g2_i1:488-5521(+)
MEQQKLLQQQQEEQQKQMIAHHQLEMQKLEQEKEIQLQQYKLEQEQLLRQQERVEELEEVKRNSFEDVSNRKIATMEHQLKESAEEKLNLQQECNHLKQRISFADNAEKRIAYLTSQLAIADPDSVEVGDEFGESLKEGIKAVQARLKDGDATARLLTRQSSKCNVLEDAVEDIAEVLREIGLQSDYGSIAGLSDLDLDDNVETIAPKLAPTLKSLKMHMSHTSNEKGVLLQRQTRSIQQRVLRLQREMGIEETGKEENIDDNDDIENTIGIIIDQIASKWRAISTENLTMDQKLENATFATSENEKQLNEARIEIEKLKETQETLETQIVELETQTRLASVQKQNIEQEMANTSSLNEELKNSLSNTNSRVSELETELGKSQNDCNEAIRRSQKLESCEDSWSRESERLNNSMIDARKMAKEAQDKVYELQQSLDESRILHRQKLNEETSKMDLKHQSELGDMREIIQEKELTCQKLEHSLQAAVRRAELAEESLESEKRDNQSYREHGINQTKKLQENEGELNRVENELKTTKMDLENMEKKTRMDLENIENEFESLKGKYETLVTDFEEKNLALNETAAELHQNRLSLEKMETKLTIEQNANEQCHESLHDTKTALKKSEDENKLFENENDLLKKKLETTEIELKDLKTHIDQETEHSHSNEMESKRKIRELTAITEDLRNELRTADNRLQRLQRENKQLNEASDDLHTQLEKSTREIDESRKRAEEAQQAKSSLEDQISTKQIELDETKRQLTQSKEIQERLKNETQRMRTDLQNSHEKSLKVQAEQERDAQKLIRLETSSKFQSQRLSEAESEVQSSRHQISQLRSELQQAKMSAATQSQMPAFMPQMPQMQMPPSAYYPPPQQYHQNMNSHDNRDSRDRDEQWRKGQEALARLETLGKERLKVEEECSSLRKSTREKCDEIESEAKQRLNEAEELEKVLKKREQNLRLKNEEQEKDFRDQQNRVTMAAEELEREKRRLNEENERLRRESELHSRQLDRVEELSACLSEAKQEIAKLQENAEDSTQREDEWQTECSQLRKKLIDVEQQLNDAQGEMDDLKESVEEEQLKNKTGSEQLQRTLEANENARKRYQAESDEFEKKIRELEKSLRDAKIKIERISDMNDSEIKNAVASEKYRLLKTFEEWKMGVLTKSTTGGLDSDNKDHPLKMASLESSFPTDKMSSAFNPMMSGFGGQMGSSMMGTMGMNNGSGEIDLNQIMKTQQELIEAAILKTKEESKQELQVKENECEDIKKAMIALESAQRDRETELENKIHEIQSELDETTLQLQKVKIELENEKSKRTSSEALLNGSLDGYKKRVNDAEEMAANFRAQLRAEQGQSEANHSRITQLDNSLQEATSQLKTYQQQIEKLREKLAINELEIEELAKSKSKQNALLKHTQADLEEITNRHTKENNNFNDLKSKQVLLIASLDKAQKDYSKELGICRLACFAEKQRIIDQGIAWRKWSTKVVCKNALLSEGNRAFEMENALRQIDILNEELDKQSENMKGVHAELNRVSAAYRHEQRETATLKSRCRDLETNVTKLNSQLRTTKTTTVKPIPSLLVSSSPSVTGFSTPPLLRKADLKFKPEFSETSPTTPEWIDGPCSHHDHNRSNRLGLDKKTVVSSPMKKSTLRFDARDSLKPRTRHQKPNNSRFDTDLLTSRIDELLGRS